MNTIFKTILGLGLVFAVTSCGTMNDPYYGNRDGRVYRAPDGTVYRQGDVHRDRNGNVYRNGQIYRRGDVYTQNRRNLPPGQAKKVYGGHATDYAKGQQKKRYGNDKYYKHNNKKYKKGKKNHHRHDD